MSGFPRHLSPAPHREQWSRVLRWRERVRVALSPPCANPDDAMDMCLALFMNLYHLRDWIKSTDATLDRAINAHVRSSRPLSLARDLCNGSKHMSLTSASVDARFLTAMEYLPPPLSGEDGPSYRLMMLTTTERIEMGELADLCIESWRSFMAAHNLHSPAV
jgi:hypothetical protein